MPIAPAVVAWNPARKTAAWRAPRKRSCEMTGTVHYTSLSRQRIEYDGLRANARAQTGANNHV